MTPPSPTRPDSDDEPLDPQLQAIAAAILDGEDIDWASWRSGPVEDFATELRIVADLAGLHRSLPLEPATASRLFPELPRAMGTLTLTRSLGSGSFGEVFRAWDSRLERDVAVKLLFRDRGDENDGQRFLREGRLLARVRHPNVVTVHGAELMDGRVGLITEFVDGRTLAEIVRAEGPLPLDEAIRIGLDLCRALIAVHDAGLLHRDIKPQNVMRQRDGRIVLMDFGAGHHGKAIDQALAGTPLFLAPEVLAGTPATVRSDVYSLGVLLYHLLTGAFPVEGASLDEIREAHAASRRVAIGVRRAAVPPQLAAVIDRATAADPAARFDSAAAFEKALEDLAAHIRPVPATRRWLSVAAALLVATVAGVGWLKWTPPAPAPPEPRWILVSAFENHTDDPRIDDVLQLAFEQELMQSRRVTVVPPVRLADTLKLMKRPVVERVDAASAREVCLRDGEIRMFAAGRIERVGTTFTMNVTLNDARTGSPLFHAGVEAPSLDGILAGVKTLATRVRVAAGETRQQIEADGRLERATTGSFDALAAYTSGFAMLNARRWAPAEVALREAILYDPAFPTALIMLSHAINNQRRPSSEYLPLARRAVELSEGLPPRERYFIIGSYHSLERDPGKAIPVYEVLVREYPNDFWAVNNLIVAYERAGRYREALPLLPRRVALRPNDFDLVAATAQALIIGGGDFAAARRLVSRAVELDPGAAMTVADPFAWIKTFPVFDLWAHGHVAEATARLDEMAADARQGDQMASAIGMMNVTLGRLRAAEDAFHTMTSDSDRQELLAYASVARNDFEGARAALRADSGLLDTTRPPAPSQSTYGKGTLIVWTMIQAGFLDEARVFASRGMFDNDPTHAVRGLLLAARGNLNEAVPILDVARKTAPGNPRTFLAIEALAKGLIQRGDLKFAEEILLQAGARQTAYAVTGSRGYFWLRLRAQLLEVARQLGHTARAAEVEQELRQLLVAADPDFALLRELR